MVSEPACLDLPKLSRHGDKLNLLFQLRWKCLHSYANLSGHMNSGWLAAVKRSFFFFLLPFSNTLTCKFTQWIYERILLKSHRSSPMTSSDWYPLSRLYSLTDRLKTAPLESLHVHEALKIYVYVGMIWAHSGRPRIVGIYLTCLLTVAAETRKVRGSSKLSRSSH